MKISPLARQPIQAVVSAIVFGALLLAASVLRCGPLSAQVIPPPPVPPPASVDATQQVLAQTYQLLQHLNATNTLPAPNYAVQANFLYAAALARYRSGDRVSATYDATLAAGLAGAALSGTTVIAPLAPPAVTLLQMRVPMMLPVLPNELLRARNEIERVQQSTSEPLSAATALYRAALDRYFAGDLAGAKAGANAAFDSAEATLRAHNKH